MAEQIKSNKIRRKEELGANIEPKTQFRNSEGQNNHIEKGGNIQPKIDSRNQHTKEANVKPQLEAREDKDKKKK